MTSTQETTAHEPSRADFNPFSPESMQDPFSMHPRLREETPVFFSPLLNWWVVARYEDAAMVLGDQALFRFVEPKLSDLTMPSELDDIAPEGFTDPNRLLTDPEHHTRMRRLANHVFRTGKIDVREPEILEVTDRLIDGFAPDGATDLVASLAVPLPLIMFTRILGIPETDADRIQQWSDNNLRLTVSQLDGEAALSAWRQEIDYYRYVEKLVEERLASPRDHDVVTDLIRARDDEASGFTTAELVKFIQMLIIAGNETTRQLLGTMIFNLLEHPDQLEAVRADPSLTGAVVEEALRFSGPLPGALRSPTEDVELSGVRIPKGQTVFVLLNSVNRDDAAFEHAEEFDVHRADATKHMAFGKGAHLCLGAALARLEVRIALQRVLARLPGLRRANADPPQWNPSLVIGLARLEVEWDVTARLGRGRRTASDY